MRASSALMVAFRALQDVTNAAFAAVTMVAEAVSRGSVGFVGAGHFQPEAFAPALRDFVPVGAPKTL